jgi:hypothetical protein
MEGCDQAEAASKVAALAATLEDRLIVLWRSKHSVAAYFATQEDATLWAQKQVGDNEGITWNVMKASANMCPIADEVMKTSDLQEVYVALVVDQAKAEKAL